MNKILITCFEPFNNRSINASLEVVKRLNGLDYKLLPVGFDKIGKEIDLIAKLELDYLILCGEAQSYDNITIEKVAHNVANGKDNYGIIKNNEKIIDGDDLLYSNFDVDLKGLNLNYSYDAGKYLCNYTYYLALNKLKDTKTKVVFIHFPFIIEEGGKFELDYLVSVMNEIIERING